VAGEVVFEDVSFRYQNGRGSEGSREEIEAATTSAYQPRNNGQLVNGNAVGLGIHAGNSTGHSTDNETGNETGNEEVLEKVSFAVSPGQSVALLGATGSGKSTLVNLIPRFYDVDSGRILIDGVDVREWSPDALRKQIGVVLQQTTLFSGTIRENIAFGRPDASLEEVIAAAQAAQAHEFIAALPDGYESQVEERGVNLSGGQRQRVAIARALLIAPGILILDDSTSAVDMDTEFKIQQALDKLMLGRTTFIVAQRISSVLKADQILVLDAGRIAAQGTHRELLASSPIYREIYQSQLGSNANVALVDG
jgi:ATP-binding cassette subfamily B protein